MSPATRSGQVKRRLLRGVVEQNRETIAGLPTGTLRRKRERRQQQLARGRGLLLASGATVALGLAAVAWLGSGVGAAPGKPQGTPVLATP